MEEVFAEYFTSYVKCDDDFNPEELAQFFYAPTIMVKNGSVLRDFHSSYNLFKNGGQWRILVTTNHDF